jgi:hypothetical protein
MATLPPSMILLACLVTLSEHNLGKRQALGTKMERNANKWRRKSSTNTNVSSLEEELAVTRIISPSQILVTQKPPSSIWKLLDFTLDSVCECYIDCQGPNDLYNKVNRPMQEIDV